MVNVRIERIPLGLILASSNALKGVETTGVLTGEKFSYNGRSRFVVEGALPLQTAINSPKTVEFLVAEYDRISAFLNQIGGFHSHVNITNLRADRKNNCGSIWLGKFDGIHMRQYYPNGIELVVAINPTRTIKGINTKPHLVEGCYEDRGKLYSVSMAAYYLDRHSRKRRARLEILKRDLNEFFI